MIPPRIQREIRAWPGAAIVGISLSKKHRKLTLRYGEQERFVTLSSTASSQRAELHQLRDVRKTLAALGASRSARAKPSNRRVHNRPERAALEHIDRAPVKADPFAALGNITSPQAPRPRWIRRLFDWIVQ